MDARTRSTPSGGWSRGHTVLLTATAKAMTRCSATLDMLHPPVLPPMPKLAYYARHYLIPVGVVALLLWLIFTAPHPFPGCNPPGVRIEKDTRP